MPYGVTDNEYRIFVHKLYEPIATARLIITKGIRGPSSPSIVEDDKVLFLYY